MIPRIWQTHHCEPAMVDTLARELGVSMVTARPLAIRGLHDLDDARRFLSPSLDQLLDPFRLADMERAVVRLEAAIARRERIAVHGDYDVDGITSTVILRRTLELLGGDVIHFVPERLRDGYGLQPARSTASRPTASRSSSRSTAASAAPRRRATPDRSASTSSSPTTTSPTTTCPTPSRRQPEATRLRLPGQAPGRRRRRAQAGAGALRPGGAGALGARLRQGGGHRDAGRRRAAGRREPRHRQARARDAVERPAQGRPPGAARGQQPGRQDHRQLSHRLHAGAAHQRRRPDEHARHRRPPAAGRRRADGRGGTRPCRTARGREHAAAHRGAGDRHPGAQDRRHRS